MADIPKEELKKEITAILKDANLATTSAKKVRQQIEQKLEVDLSARKKEVDEMVMQCLKEKEKKNKKIKKNGKKDDDDEDDDEEEEGDKEEEEEKDEEEEDDEEEEEEKKPKRAPKKQAPKRKTTSSDESEDASGDKESDEEYSPTKKRNVGKAKPKAAAAKGRKKKGSDSDSDEDWNKGSKGGAKKTKKAGGGSNRGYTKVCTLSPELAALVGSETMARHDVVKKVWQIIKEKNLYDPKNKQFTVCNDDLMKVIGVKRFRTFAMMKFLKKHFVD